MNKINQYITQISGKRFWCLSFLIVFTYLVSATPSNSFDLFTEKTVETEKEENKSEKEEVGEESEEIAQFSKCKKIKKNPTYFSLEVFDIQEIFSPKLFFLRFQTLSKHSFASERNTFFTPACPLYIAYHKLIFYEI
jgi:Na+-transporting methylmalonyl-CoA/oxaloacetate decarboxylase gamma subunit